MENTYEEVVLQTVMKDILQGACQPQGLLGVGAGAGGAIPSSTVLGGILIARGRWRSRQRLSSGGQ